MTRKINLVVTGHIRYYSAIIALTILITTLVSSYAFYQYGNGPLKGISIIIDPGHGGMDGGTNDGSGFWEKDINLQISNRLKALLEADRAMADLTRDCDILLDGKNNYSPSRLTRDLLARSSIFNNGMYDIFVSIHVNYSNNKQAMGPAILYWPGSRKSEMLAECIQKRLNGHTRNVLNENINYVPVKSKSLLLQTSAIPGVIVETGFMSNPIEKKLLQDEEYQLKLAKTIRLGIKDYFRLLKKTKKNSTDNSSPEEESTPFNSVNDIKVVDKGE